jgi:hypothetical protein
MPLPNRVTPFGDLTRTPERGMFMGNRGGRFHDDSQHVPGVPWAGRSWLICETRFRDRQRMVWGQGYTEVFFCDEVTALAAGHRPCMECRRTAALSFRCALASAGVFASCPRCPVVDARLDRERRALRRAPLIMEAARLPDGAMIVIEGRAHALRGPCALPWSHAGYGPPMPRPTGPARVLTPPLTLHALAAGYRPVWREPDSVQHP